MCRRTTTRSSGRRRYSAGSCQEDRSCWWRRLCTSRWQAIRLHWATWGLASEQTIFTPIFFSAASQLLRKWKEGSQLPLWYRKTISPVFFLVSRDQGKSEKCKPTPILYHTLLRIHVIGGEWFVRNAPPSLAYSSATIGFQSSIPV